MCSTIGIYFTITNIKLGFSIFKPFIKFIIKLHLHFVLEWVNLICTCQPSNALQHYVMATNTFCPNFFTHRAGPHVIIRRNNEGVRIRQKVPGIISPIIANKQHFCPVYRAFSSFRFVYLLREYMFNCTWLYSRDKTSQHLIIKR